MTTLLRSFTIAAILLTGAPMVPAVAQTVPQLSTHDTADTADAESSDNLMKMLDEPGAETAGKREYVTAIFKATRLINGHSIENLGMGVLDFRISHRFNTLNTGIQDFFGLDGATTRLGFDYGVTNWLMVGIGRSSFEKEYDGFIKAKILRQTTDNRIPFSLSYLGSAMIKTVDVTVPAGTEYYTSNRMAYANQLIIARKFSESFSLQLMPTHVHYNLVKYRDDPNEVLAIGIGGRLKLSRRISLNGEWYYRLPGSIPRDTRNSLAIGFDIETGGHVFQLHFTNSTGMTERTFVGQTTGDWADGDIRFGFNISRVFTIVRPKAFKNSRNKIY
jgi:hypothetical protein